MKPKEFWQNFKMGEEQEIACNFIYDGLRNLHEMETLNLESEIFPVLYNLSIGLERMFKVAIVLVEVDDNTDIDKFEETLKIHNHIALYNRLKKSKKSVDLEDLKFGPVHTGLLTLLSTFYKEHRYGRFNLPKRDNLSKDKKLFLTFLQKYLNLKIEDDIIGMENSLQIKKFIGKTVKKITKDLYAIIDKAATAKNLYTYELSDSSSKAAKIVWGDGEINFENDEIVMMEVLLFLLKTDDINRINLLKKLEPLPLDPAEDAEYLHFLIRKRTGYMSSIIDQVEDAQADSKDCKKRIEFIKAIKDPSIGFDFPEEE